MNLTTSDCRVSCTTHHGCSSSTAEPRPCSQYFHTNKGLSTTFGATAFSHFTGASTQQRARAVCRPGQEHEKKGGPNRGYSGNFRGQFPGSELNTPPAAFWEPVSTVSLCSPVIFPYSRQFTAAAQASTPDPAPLEINCFDVAIQPPTILWH